MTARSIPKSLAPVVEDLELRQPQLVTKGLLTEIIEERGLRQRSDEVAHRLQQNGWLLSLKTKDTWEFAPAARAGRIGSGDPLIELRAILHHRPDFPVAVAFESAAWLHGLLRRPPEKEVISIPADVTPPPALSDFRITRMQGQLSPIQIDQLPTWGIETLIVLMGERPLSFRAWPTVSEWLAEAVERIDREFIMSELVGRRLPTWVRTGYILEVGGRSDLGELIHSEVKPARQGPFYLGPRQSPGEYNQRWDVRDSILVHQEI